MTTRGAALVLSATVVLAPVGAVLGTAAAAATGVGVTAKVLAFATEDPSEVSDYVGLAGDVAMDLGPGSVVSKPLRLGYRLTERGSTIARPVRSSWSSIEEGSRRTTDVALDAHDLGWDAATKVGGLLSGGDSEQPQPCRLLTDSDYESMSVTPTGPVISPRWLQVGTG